MQNIVHRRDAKSAITLFAVGTVLPRLSMMSFVVSESGIVLPMVIIAQPL